MGSADLRDRVDGGHTVVGTFGKLPGLEAVDCLKDSGLDFAVLDMEHSQLDDRELGTQLAYASAIGFPCLVRVAEVRPQAIGRYLEAGAVGIVLSGVRTRAQADAFVRAARFPPLGERGVSTTVRAAAYGRVPVADYLERCARPLLVAQIECAETDDPLEAILAAGIDVCFVGVVDLSVDLGVPGDLTSPALAGRLSEIAAAAGAAGVAFGHHVAGGLAPHAGARWLTAGTDVSVLATGLERLARETREALPAS